MLMERICSSYFRNSQSSFPLLSHPPASLNPLQQQRPSGPTLHSYKSHSPSAATPLARCPPYAPSHRFLSSSSLLLAPRRSHQALCPVLSPEAACAPHPVSA